MVADPVVRRSLARYVRIRFSCFVRRTLQSLSLNDYMRSVLGIDAAWTAKEPSGVAVIADDGSGWSLRTAASSYLDFVEPRDPDLGPTRPRGSIADAAALLSFSHRILGHPVDVVAVDMPLSLERITARRVSDNQVSSAYGARQCGTHTPSAVRPGPISDNLRQDFEDLGYHLATTDVEAPALLEVYPHPALVELMDAPKRLPYKHSKTRNYWPTDTIVQRRANLFDVWHSIIAHLENEISGVSEQLRLPEENDRGYRLKAFEDRLDAVVCAWVGACALDGRARPFGDATSAIWVPDQLKPR